MNKTINYVQPITIAAGRKKETDKKLQDQNSLITVLYSMWELLSMNELISSSSFAKYHKRSKLHVKPTANVNTENTLQTPTL